MKLLVVSDIHGNWSALQSVLDAEADYDKILCLGDLVDYGPEPVACVAWAMKQNNNAISIQGNHDWGVALRKDPRGSPPFRHLTACTQAFSLKVLSFFVMRWAVGRRTVSRRACWDGGIGRLLPEMTYTATGFSNPVRVIFQAIFRPTIVEDTRKTVAEHFRTAIRREREEVHIVDRFVLQPVRRAALRFAAGLATMHRGQLNAYITYGVLSLILVLLLLRLFQGII